MKGLGGGEGERMGRRGEVKGWGGGEGEGMGRKAR